MCPIPTILESGLCLLLAEAVEEVGPNRICATIDLLGWARGNIDLTLSRILNHCFKNSDPRDFFDSLSQKRTFVGALEVQNKAIGWLWKECSSLGGGTAVRFP